MVNGNGSSRVLRFLHCKIREEAYCLNMSWVRGIQRADQLHQTENDQGLAGWLDGDHQKIPVFRLATLLKQPLYESRRMGKILVLKTQPHPWGLLVDRVEGVIQVTSSQVFPLPAIARNPTADFFEGVVKHDGKMMLALSPEGLHPDAPAGAARPLPAEHSLDTLYSVADISTAPGTKGKVILFTTVPDQPITFGLSLSQVPQILRPLPILPLPEAVAYVLGLVEWRGVPLPVIDLLGRLGGAVSPVETDGRLLIARASTTRACVGLPIRPQVNIHDLPIAHHISDRPVPLQEALIRGNFTLEHTTLVIPDIDGILVSHHDCPAYRRRKDLRYEQHNKIFRPTRTMEPVQD